MRIIFYRPIIENLFHHSKSYLRYNRTSYALIINTLNSQNRKYVNTTSSVILAYAIALAPRSRPFTHKRKNNPVVVGGGVRHLRRWFFLPVEPSTCIYIKWRVVGIFKSNSLSNKHELVQKGRPAGWWTGGVVNRRCEKGESLSTTSEITSSFLFHDPLHPEVLATPAGVLSLPAVNFSPSYFRSASVPLSLRDFPSRDPMREMRKW